MTPVVPAAALDLRAVAYTPNGARLGLLPHPLSLDAGWPVNDVPGLQITYSTHAAGAEHLAGPVEIAIEYAVRGGAWVEPPGGRFLRIKHRGDVVDATGARTYTLPGYGWVLSKAVLYPGPGALVDGKRAFLSATAGAILQTFIAEGQARGALAGLAFDFSPTHDSAGTPWSKIITIYYEPGMSALTAIINLAEQGMIDWQMQGRTLRAFNADTTLASDLAGGPAPVDLRIGRDITEAPDEASLEDAASAVYVSGDDGFHLELTNPAAVAPWGRWEQWIGQGGVSDPGTATVLAQAALDRAGRERVQITRGITPAAARWVPWHDYSPGDYVLAPGATGAMESLRVRQITLTRDADGISGNVVLNDRFLEREIRLARRTAGILGGSTADGGSGTRPAPERPAGRIPAAPAGLVVDAQAYIDAGGYPQGLIVATWGHVASDIGGVAINVDSYELFARLNEVTEPWFLVATTEAGDNSASYSPLTVGQEYGFKVRATYEGMKGQFSLAVAVLIPDDTTPPPVPTAPQLVTRLGVIHVGWDGLGVGATPMPADFDLVRVWMQDPLAPGWEPIDYLTEAGAVVVVDQPYGASREFRLTAIDRSGNESAPSGSATIATAPLVDTDIIGQVIDGANIVDGSITASDKVIANTVTGGLIQALAIDAGKLAANAVTTDKLAAGSVTAGKLEAVLTVTTRLVAGNAAAARVELNSSGVQAYNASGAQTVNIANSGAFTLRSGTTGARIDISTVSGLQIFDAAGTVTVRLDTSGFFQVRSAVTGARVELDPGGLRGYNGANTATFRLDSSNGEVDIIGRLSSGPSGKRLVINPLLGGDPEIRMYEDSVNYHYWTAAVGAGVDRVMQMGSAPNDGNWKGLLQLEGRSAKLTIGPQPLAEQYGVKIYDAGWIDFFGKLGQPGPSGTFARASVQFPAGTIGSVGWGFTFVDGDAFLVATIFSSYGVHGICINNRSNSGFGFSTTNGAPAVVYEVQYFAWKQ